MSGPSQPKVIGEDWSDERIKGYLELSPYDDTDADFFVLEKAYRGMVATDFGRFIEYFKAANRNLDAQNPDGKTIREIIAQHSKSQTYLTLLD